MTRAAPTPTTKPAVAHSEMTPDACSDEMDAHGPVLRVTIPMAPPAECSPNYHGHWRRRYQWSERFGDEAYWAVESLATLPPLSPPIAYRAVIRWGKGRRMHDDDNAAAMLKSARDRIAGFLGINDRQMRCVEVTQERDQTGHGETVIDLWGDE